METPVKILLDRKREGRELSPSDIHDLIAAYTKGEVTDYQMAAFAMAVCCNGMTGAETLALTEAMRDSGDKMDWSDVPLPTADKHSTGGVGDKLSLIIQPLAASCGVAVPSLTGRGLGLTGGTADKLESIPGYNASLSLADFKKVVASCGCSMTVQTAEIAPADKKLYALRDVTGTVPSIPLIVASILSKKLAEGAETLVFDVKCGRGAFMKTRDQAAALAQALVNGAKGAGRKACALVTSMDEPLGFAVGNALEVQESIDVLKGEGRQPADIVELSVEFAARMVALAKCVSLDDARKECRDNLGNGKAYAVFAEMVKLHGGDLAEFERMYAGGGGASSVEVLAPASGFISDIDAETVARAAFNLGAGRAKTGDTIDMSAGVLLSVTHGDKVEKGQTLAKLFARDRTALLEAEAKSLESAFAISGEAPSVRRFIIEEIL
ncbi:MAG: thymidine phosphorylase [Kiritimatiellae bacterium]|nr:thymidine phosphorylase [Kiritimatiellia bacterium]